MSKRSSRKNKELLLDTSFLLPILGFETSKRIMKTFEKPDSYELYYNDLSILEALWKIVKKIKGIQEEIQRIVEWVKAINETLKYAPVNEKAVENSIKMYQLGHWDLLDNLLYSTALYNGIKLLTIDTKLIQFVKTHKLPKTRHHNARRNLILTHVESTYMCNNPSTRTHTDDLPILPLFNKQ